MRRYISVMLLALTIGCGLSKKQQSETGVKLHEVYQQQNELKAKAIAITQQKVTDTSNAQFSLTIKPKGKFNYSTRGGFVGEAEYVALNGNNSIRSVKSLATLEAEAIALKEKTATTTKQQVDTTTQSNTQLKSSFNLILLGILMAAFLVWLGYHKFFR